MTKYITIKLTEDQAKELDLALFVRFENLVDEFGKVTKQASYTRRLGAKIRKAIYT